MGLGLGGLGLWLESFSYKTDVPFLTRLPIVSIVVPFVGLTIFILRIL